MAAPAKILAWFTHRQPPRRDPSEHVYSDMLERGVPEIMEERLDSGAPEPPHNRRKRDKKGASFFDEAPRWLLVGCLGLTCAAALYFYQKNESKTEQAIEEAKRRAESREMERLGVVEEQQRMTASILIELQQVVKGLQERMNSEQAQHAKQAEVMAALTRQLETLNANLKARQ